MNPAEEASQVLWQLTSPSFAPDAPPHVCGFSSYAHGPHWWRAKIAVWAFHDNSDVSPPRQFVDWRKTVLARRPPAAEMLYTIWGFAHPNFGSVYIAKDPFGNAPNDKRHVTVLARIAVLDQLTLPELDSALPRGLLHIRVGFAKAVCNNRYVRRRVKAMPHIYTHYGGLFWCVACRRDALWRERVPLRVHLAWCLSLLGLPRDMCCEIGRWAYP